MQFIPLAAVSYQRSAKPELVQRTQRYGICDKYFASAISVVKAVDGMFVAIADG